MRLSELETFPLKHYIGATSRTGGFAVQPTITPAGDGVFQIHLTPDLPGFGDFISSWLVTGPTTYIVDVGPASTADQLVRGLERLGVARLDFILITHIHLDHAGATGHIAARFPEARIVCHDKGIPHLADPAQLWEGSRKVLGPVADGYGPLRPTPAERFIPAQGFDERGISALITPGHAAHHASFDTGPVLFAGEACGVLYALRGGDYMRPATPPRFFLTTALASMDLLVARAPGRMVVGHHGIRDNGTELLCRHREQLLFWERWIAAHQDDAAAGDAVERLAAGLLAEDPLLRAFADFPAPAQQRERYFLKNSINGFLGWVREKR
jgi:glyoxylase-like metal-dependent hydrolase (beta-lactamase superfamily II)